MLKRNMPFIGKDGYKYADNSTFFKIHNNELIHKNISVFFLLLEKYKSFIVRQKKNQNLISKQMSCGQFKTLQDFSDVLRRKSNWLCEYKILKTVIFRKSLRFDMTCCSHIQPFLKHEFPFINGLYCILDKKCKFFLR